MHSNKRRNNYSQNNKRNKKPFNPKRKRDEASVEIKPKQHTKKFKVDFKSDEKNMPRHDAHKNFASQESNMKRLIIKPGTKWFEQLPTDPSPTTNPSPQDVESLRKEAEQLMSEDIAHYKKFTEKRKEKSDFSWMRTILHSGTLSDKISAHTLFIQDSPVHNINSIEILLGMVNPKAKRECFPAMDCLKDLFLSDLLLPEKKLKSFCQHPLSELNELTSGNIVSRKKRLVLWYFEDQLKNLFCKFVKNVEAVSRDTVEKTKQKSVTVTYELLRHNPEQEQFLLEHLVNKIGDPIARVGSHACHLLGQLVSCHPAMISVIVKEVERLLFRQNVAERAKYYCLCFLNQLILSQEQSNIANHLITMYFGLFKSSVKKGEVDTKMMSALLSGVSRAYPYAKLKNNVIMDQLDAMFRLVHLVSFNISVQALSLIFQVLKSADSVSDRFYSALYCKLLDPAICSSSRQPMLLNLIFKALKNDSANVRVKAFVKRLLQISLYMAPNFQCGILMLISELSKSHVNILDAKQFVTYDDDDDSGSDEHYDDVPDEDTKDFSKNKTEKKVPIEGSSWIHRQSKSTVKRSNGYDPYHRNPLHAGSEYSKLWELPLLKKCYHPTLSLFGHQVANSQQITYNGDPLTDFTLIRFLDRFVYRNLKKVNESAEANVQRKIFGRKHRSRSEVEAIPITSHSFVQQKESNVPVNEQFIYRYLRQRASTGKRKDDSDMESIGDDEFETLLNDMHAEDEGKDTLDFAKELNANKAKIRNKQPESDGDSDSLGDDSDEEVSFADDAEFEEAFKDYDEDMKEMVDEEGDVFIDNFDEEKFNDDDGDFIECSTDKRIKSKKRQRSDPENMFASADEFATLLEENADNEKHASSSQAFINTDKSAMKQLAWERNRDQFVRGTDWKSRKNNSKKKFQFKKKKFSKR